MPDSVIGQILVGAAVVGGIIFGGEIIATGTAAVETLVSLISTGYAYLISLPYLGRTIKIHIERYNNFVTTTFNNTMSFGLYNYISSFKEATTDLKIIIATFTAPVGVVTGMAKLFTNLDELVYDIKNDDDKEEILDLIDYFIIPGDQDERLGGDSYGS